MKKEFYAPREKTARILARAMALVKSVPYQVSARWLFYRLLQESLYSEKGDYKNKFLPAVSRARHAFYGNWRPDTLADETRAAIVRGQGYETPNHWLTALTKGVACNLSKWDDQPCYVEMWYEARAMSDQFRHYTKHITLRPLGGQPSIPYKWQIAKDLEWAAQRFNIPIVVLYFGDLDTAGETISKVTEQDVRKWCKADFEFIHCGLTAEQVARYGVPENPEKPGEFQWEALADNAAHEVITANVNRFVRHDAFSQTVAREQTATDWLRAQLAGLSLP